MANSKKPKPIPKDNNKVAMSIPNPEDIKRAKEFQNNMLKIRSRNYVNEAIMALGSKKRTEAFIARYGETPQQAIDSFNNK